MQDDCNNDGAVNGWRWRRWWRNVVEMWFGSQMKMSCTGLRVHVNHLAMFWRRAAVYLTEWNLVAFLTHSRRLSMTSKECDACGTPVRTQHGVTTTRACTLHAVRCLEGVVTVSIW